MFNHTYYQGILLIIGKYRNMQTFVPKQDKTRNSTMGTSYMNFLLLQNSRLIPILN